MKILKRFIALATLVFMLGSSARTLSAVEYCYDTAGCGYEECRQAPCLTPAIALAAIALVAIIAVAVENSSHSSHGHGHN